jgi:hypothetical protein
MSKETKKEIWIVKGQVTDASLYDYDKATLGQVEYQCGDGPPNERTCSADFVDLEKALAAFSGFVVHWVG